MKLVSPAKRGTTNMEMIRHAQRRHMVNVWDALGIVEPAVWLVCFGVVSNSGVVAGDMAADRYFTAPVQWSVDNDITGIVSAWAGLSR